MMQNNTTTKPLNQNKMKQTAVDWLFDNLNITGGSDDMKAFEQAKEMEKQQIMDAANSENSVDINYGERYYNETFKSE